MLSVSRDLWLAARMLLTKSSGILQNGETFIPVA